jgi:hypothetical protein
MVLFSKVISHPFVPSHRKFTPEEPGPPLVGALSAPSASPGATTDFPQLTTEAANPVPMPPPRN